MAPDAEATNRREPPSSVYRSAIFGKEFLFDRLRTEPVATPPISSLARTLASVTAAPKVYFTDFFGVDPAALHDYAAFDISLVNDLPCSSTPSFSSTARSPNIGSCMIRSSATCGS
jgi:hypothetical protein